MTRQYKVMMKRRGKWWDAHVNCQRAKITYTYEDAVKEMERVKRQRLECYGNPADDYKIVSREVTDWTDE